jgi:hypothetical protein
LYEVVADPSQGTTYPLSGFSVPEGEAPNVFRWMVEQNARIAVHAACERCVGTLEFRAASFARPRLLIVLDEQGRALVAKGIPSDRPVLVKVPLRFSRQTVVRLRTDPPPERVSDVVGGTDTREVAVSVIQPVRFVRK